MEIRNGEENQNGSSSRRAIGFFRFILFLIVVLTLLVSCIFWFRSLVGQISDEVSVTEIQTQNGAYISIAQDQDGSLLGNGLSSHYIPDGERIIIMPTSGGETEVFLLPSSVMPGLKMQVRVGVEEVRGFAPPFGVSVDIFYSGKFFSTLYQAPLRLGEEGEVLTLTLEIPSEVDPSKVSFLLRYKPMEAYVINFPIDKWNVTYFIEILDEIKPGDVPPVSQTSPPSTPTETEEEGSETPSADWPDCQPLKTQKVEGPTPWLHTVHEGETLPDLSQRFLGNASQWPIIVANNPNHFGTLSLDGNPPPIHSGQELMIPNVESPIKHIVQPGEHLTNIAADYYGKDYDSGSLWCTGYFENEKIIGKNPGRIVPGQELVFYPLQLLEENEIWVRSHDRFSGIIFAYFQYTIDVGDLCTHYPEFGPGCNNIMPFDIIRLMGLPESRRFRVQPGQTLDDIVYECYGFDSPELVEAALIVNRTIIGDDPQWIYPGQTLTLYGCY